MNMNIYIRDHNLIPGENNSLRQRRSMCQWKGICHDIGLNQRATHFCKKNLRDVLKSFTECSHFGLAEGE